MTDYPKPRACGHCDFSMGTRGMDRCAPCDGTGSVFRIGTADGIKSFPNTREGWVEACKVLGLDPDGDDS